jgi:tryptophanyl-tRNA synthetase
VTDDEKFLYRPEFEVDKFTKMGLSKIKDIIAFDFDQEKTFIFLDLTIIMEK